MLKFLIKRKQHPVSTGNAQTAARTIETWQIRLRDTDAVLEGLGEIAIWPHLGIGPAEVAKDIQALSASEFDSLTTIERFLQEQRISSPVRFGFELALLDYDAKTRKCSLGELLWKKPVSPVTCHRLVGMKMLDEASSTSSIPKRSHLKVKINGNELHETVPLLKTLLTVINPKSLRLDANGSLDYSSASFLCDALEGSNLILEQPFAPADLAGHDRLQQQTSVVVALDESMILDPLGAEETSCRQLVMKPMYTGGLLQTRDRGIQLLAQNRSICITHVLESAVGRGGAIHLATGFASTGPHGVGHQTDALLIDTEGQIGHGGSFDA